MESGVKVPSMTHVPGCQRARFALEAELAKRRKMPTFLAVAVKIVMKSRARGTLMQADSKTHCTRGVPPCGTPSPWRCGGWMRPATSGSIVFSRCRAALCCVVHPKGQYRIFSRANVFFPVHSFFFLLCNAKQRIARLLSIPRIVFFPV